MLPDGSWYLAHLDCPTGGYYDPLEMQCMEIVGKLSKVFFGWRTGTKLHFCSCLETTIVPTTTTSIIPTTKETATTTTIVPTTEEPAATTTILPTTESVTTTTEEVDTTAETTLTTLQEQMTTTTALV